MQRNYLYFSFKLRPDQTSFSFYFIIKWKCYEQKNKIKLFAVVKLNIELSEKINQFSYIYLFLEMENTMKINKGFNIKSLVK